ncbi:MAG: transcriptional repressor, partial [Rhodospirillaceae bacterium]|nr:transcriptional repressor [Rhodospirillaceae bacterium]
DDHYHFYHENEGALVDIPGSEIEVSMADDIPFKSKITDVDVIIRLQSA